MIIPDTCQLLLVKNYLMLFTPCTFDIDLKTRILQKLQIQNSISTFRTIISFTQ